MLHIALGANGSKENSKRGLLELRDTSHSRATRVVEGFLEFRILSWTTFSRTHHLVNLNISLHFIGDFELTILCIISSRSECFRHAYMKCIF